MKNEWIVIAFAAISVSFGAVGAGAQGPAGAGAAAAAQESSHSSRAPNPINWVKKDNKNSTDALGNRSDLERKLTPNLQEQGLLAANSDAADACAMFTALDGCLAALHASHNLGVDFICLRAAVTGVHTSVDVSGCKVADGDKPLALRKAIHLMKPDADAKQSAKDAEQQAREDLQKFSR
jgi:hypothetical protein